MRQNENIVIIGAGIAGVSAAKTLRENQFEGQITLVDQDESMPYDRPPLSKEYLKGEMDKENILLHSESFYFENNIKLELGKKVVAIHPDEKLVSLQNGQNLPWDKLLITTGSKLKRLQTLDEKQMENVFYLKTRKDADYLKKELSTLKELVIIGAGFIGLEVAASLTSLGKKVTVLEAAKTPLARVLGEDMGSYIADVHRSKGVDIITDDFVTDFMGDSTITKVQTKKGRSFTCDGVLIGIGVYPDDSLYEGLLDGENGIIVDEFCESSIPGIFAAGDCARWPYSVSGELIRIEHWDHALNHGRTAAINMMYPKSEKYQTIPYFWSDQYHLSFQYLGHPAQWDETVVRGLIQEDRFTKFYLHEQRVVGALIVNQPRNVLPIRRLINHQLKVDAAELMDETIELRSLVKKQTV